MAKYWKWVAGLTLLIVIGFAAWAIFVPSAKDIYNTTDIKIMEASIVSKEEGDDGFYLKVDVPGMAGSPYYASTSSEFYQQALPGSKVGVVLGYVDAYKARPSFDKKKLYITYSGTSYEVLALYPNLADAQKENPPVSFTTRATLKQRVKSDDYRYFFIMDAGGKSVMAEVGRDYYDRFPPASVGENYFELKFAGKGDFIQLVGIIDPQ